MSIRMNPRVEVKEGLDAWKGGYVPPKVAKLERGYT